MKVKIYGAGSIGNHLARACRNKGWQVAICDIDQSALDRTKNEIYPGRYGKWDNEIKLCLVADAPTEFHDLVIIGSPPDTHLRIALQELQNCPPKVILVEKPVCTPSLDEAQAVVNLAKETGTILTVGYNHVLTENTKRATDILKENVIGSPVSISARFREHWGGIFGAHPWLNGPQDTYLGYYKRGGGATGEHSHAINLWQYFALQCGMGKIVRVHAMMDMVHGDEISYDRLSLMSVQTEKGYVGDIVQDVITDPAQKIVRIQGNQGYIEWQAGRDSQHDSVCYKNSQGETHDEMIHKTRPKDFQGEIDELERLLLAEKQCSSISLEHGLDTMLVVSAAYMSQQKQRMVKINYDAGYSLNALEVI